MRFKNFIEESNKTTYLEITPEALRYKVQFFTGSNVNSGWKVYLTGPETKKIFGKLFPHKTQVACTKELEAEIRKVGI